MLPVKDEGPFRRACGSEREVEVTTLADESEDGLLAVLVSCHLPPVAPDLVPVGTVETLSFLRNGER